MSLEKWPWSNVEAGKHEHELFSIAVSLKRIADILEKASKPPTMIVPKDAELL